MKYKDKTSESVGPSVASNSLWHIDSVKKTGGLKDLGVVEWGKQEREIKRYIFPVTKWVSHGAEMYSMGNGANDIIKINK